MHQPTRLQRSSRPGWLAAFTLIGAVGCADPSAEESAADASGSALSDSAAPDGATLPDAADDGDQDAGGGESSWGQDAALDATSDATEDPGDAADPGLDGSDDISGGADDAFEEPDVGPIDCEALPAGPFPLVKLEGPIASEDLAFDREGHLVGSNDATIFKSPYPGSGSPKVFVPKVSFRAGMRFLPNGHLVICDSDKGQLTRIDETGTMHTVLSGLSYPNGIIVDLQGWVYFTEQNTNLVSRVNPYSGERQILTNKVQAPNGLIFSPDYRTLYIGGFSGEGTIYALSLSAEGVPGKVVKWATNVGTGALDGMGADACGNIYVCDYGATIVYRISPDGQTKVPIIDGSSEGAYLPNMQWGSGAGGWDPLALYFPDGWRKEVFEVKIGVPGAPRPFP
jgi:hypothetical protein